MRRVTQLLFAIFAISESLCLISFASAAAPGQAEFAHRIQPIFARRCYKCHGPTAEEGGLRLDQRDAALSELDSGEFAIVPGKASDSELMRRLRSDDDDMRMPPDGKPLTEEEIQLIDAWIKNGAPWAGHWSFRKPTRPSVPSPQDSTWIRNPIDAFILSELEAAGLKPASPANRIALLRRAYYDLTGLPPTPEQIDTFLADESPQAFERVVDQLLESDQYGEKWARHWLDVVRYAETNGYERDSPKDLIWKYRDYVIRAFNEDKPFDRFILEQLAGDELPDRDADSITATGYYRLGIWDDEPADPELARYDYLDDILRTTGEGFLAMTIGCARCHDHKIDPIAQRDYYSMLDFFSDVSAHGKGGTNHVKVASAADRKDYEAKRTTKEARESLLETRVAEIRSQFLSGLKQLHPDLVTDGQNPEENESQVVVPDSIEDGQEWEFTLKKPADNWFQIAFDDSQWKKASGGFGTRGTPGAKVRTRWRTRDIWLRKDFRLESLPSKLTLRIHHDEDVEVYLNGARVAQLKGYVTDYKQVDITADAVDVLQTGRNTLAIHCRQTGGGQYIDAGLEAHFGLPPAYVLAREHGVEVLGEARLAEWNQKRRELKESRSQSLSLRTDTVMAVGESGRHKTWILGRGSPAMKGEEVNAAYPGILKPPAAVINSVVGTSTSGKRLALARWIASADNPMTARVTVNRIWQHHFGRGIVRSASDFGQQGTPPTHPVLLDWLAVEFVESGWQVKALHKLIMMSNTYQMSSEPNSKAAAKDPINDLFWRYNMRRLTAEEIRDSILAVTGSLNKKMFGSSVFPPLSAEVLATSSTPHRAWGNSSPEDAVRRSIYVHVKRSLRPPMFANFDAPDTDTPCSARVTTTVPTQALGMLNSRFMNEQAAKFAERIQRESPKSLRGQIGLAARLTTGRTASADELDADEEFIAGLQRDEELSADDALRVYCLMMLNTNEFFYLD